MIITAKHRLPVICQALTTFVLTTQTATTLTVMNQAVTAVTVACLVEADWWKMRLNGPGRQKSEMWQNIG